MKRQAFREGELVEIVTVDGGRGSRTTADHRPKPLRKERWRGVIIGPSVIGPGWWVVKKMNAHGFRWMTYTVPDIELVRVKR